MPSLHPHATLAWALWVVAGFGAAVLYCSFFEWTVHRFVMHKRQRWLPFPYELHAVQHHGLFGADETYHAQDENMRGHIVFVLRDYVLLTLVNLPIYIAVELLVQRPVALGCLLATLTYLQVFNSIHLRFHDPRDSWLQRTRLFRFLKRHHLLHHENPTRNTNVVLPLADLCFGTLHMKPINPEKVLKV